MVRARQPVGYDISGERPWRGSCSRASWLAGAGQIRVLYAFVQYAYGSGVRGGEGASWAVRAARAQSILGRMSPAGETRSVQGLSFARNAGCGLARSWPRLQVEMSAGPLKAAAQIFRPGKVLVLGSPDGCGLRQKANISSWCSNMLKAKMEAWPPLSLYGLLKAKLAKSFLGLLGLQPSASGHVRHPKTPRAQAGWLGWRR